MSNILILNSAARKNWNTAQLLQEAKKGAEDAGIETEYIDLYDLSFTGCRSCMACKVKDGKRCQCFWKDDLTPVINKILEADNLIIGSPIYFGETTAHFHALMERLLFCCMSYDGEGTYLQKKINTGFIYTMNAPKALYESMFKAKYEFTESLFRAVLNGTSQSVAACDTLQVSNYDKFAMKGMNEQAKREHREQQFPIDLKNAYNLENN